MSVLEHIRKRPALVIGVLGLALLLFLFTGIDRIGDLFTDRDTAARIDGEKIKIQALNARADRAREAMQRQGASDVDYARIQQDQLQSMINETLIDKEVERLGIDVTDAEIEAIFFGPQALPYFTNMANSYGFETVADLYNFAYSDDPQADQVRAIWEDMENSTRQDLRMQKFMSLLGALNVNKLDAKAYYDDNAATSTVVLAHQDITSLPDDEFPVSDSEISSRYKEMKELYSIPTEETLVDYILVNVKPSSEDYLAASKEVEDAVIGLKTTPSTEAVSANFNFKTTNVTGRPAGISDIQIKTNLDKLMQDTVVLLPFSNDTYTILKLMDRYTAQDSVYLDLAAIDPAADTDSIITLLNAGTDPSTIPAVISTRENTGFSLIEPQNAAYKDQILAATPGAYFVLDTDNAEGQPAMAMKVVSLPAAAQIIEVAKVTREVEPSTATYNMLTDKLRDYLAANKTLDSFKQNAAEAEYYVQEAIVDPSMLSFNNLPSSTAAARWAMENKKGAISEIFTDDANTYLLALAVEDNYNDYLPASNNRVATDIANRIRAEKKAARLVEDYKGKANDIEGYAALMKMTPDTVNVIYGQEYVRGFIPGDPNLLANIAVAKEGQLVGPFDTRNGVVVLKVTGTENHGREFNFDTDGATLRQREIRGLQQNLQNILRANKKTSYNLQRFFGN